MPSNFKALAGASGGEPNDPNFRNVTLLLHGDGSNGAQNNTFIDSSTNNFTITRNGNTTQGSFSPYGSNWSNYFDGSGDYLTSPSSSALGFGTGDFTVEAWVYTPAFSAIQAIIDLRSSAVAEPLALSISSTGLARSYDLTVRTGGQLNANQWNHIAWVRASGVNTVYVNGAVGHTWTNSGDYGSSRPAWIGMTAGGGSEPFTGYISNLRVVKGTAVYTAAFTPSTTPLTAITNTSLLTCQSNRFHDASTNNFTITRNGDVKVTNFAPFAPTAAYSTSTNGGSAYFDGTSDWLDVANNAAFGFGTGDYTVEFWLNLNSLPPSTKYTIVDFRTSAGAAPHTIYVTSSGYLGFFNGSSDVTSSSAPMTANAWTHIAYSRASGTLRIYVNGVQAYSAANTIDYLSSRQCRIGAAVEGIEGVPGYISNFRVVKGTAVYTAAFTPPTSPVTAITNTQLLTNFTNGAIFDNSMKNDLETVGNAQISTSVKKFGTGSMAFDGSGDYLFSPASSELAFSNGNFTIEFWAYLNTTSGIQLFYDGRPGNGSYPAIYMNGASLRYYVNSVDRITGSNLTTGVWYHIAISRSGTSTKMFLNGVQDGSTYSDSTTYASGPLRIGADYNPSNYLNGYIDDLRVTNGIARYTANFTPPTAAFPNK